MNQGSRAATLTHWSRTGWPLAGDLAGRSEAAPANVSADLPVPGCSASPRYQAVHMPHLFPAMMRYRYSAERIGCGRLYYIWTQRLIITLTKFRNQRQQDRRGRGRAQRGKMGDRERRVC